MTIADNIARLREALAAGPSSGPYRTGGSSICREEWTCYSEDGASCWQPIVASGGRTLLLIVDSHDGAGLDRPSFDADAALHAAADPATIAALLAAWDEREAMREDALIGRWLMSKFDTHSNGWSIETVFDGAPSLEELRDVLIDAARKETP